MDIKEIGRIVREKRKSIEFTQVDAAGMCNVGVRFFSELENGKSTLQVGKVLTVLARLGLEITISDRADVE
ncbi:MAG: helix-turn-helix transcriptional regulator [Desulfobacterales bacterium]|nr:helix-turn-helix transcriptional regulator [Desulfobacterales bacterium]